MKKNDEHIDRIINWIDFFKLDRYDTTPTWINWTENDRSGLLFVTIRLDKLDNFAKLDKLNDSLMYVCYTRTRSIVDTYIYRKIVQIVQNIQFVQIVQNIQFVQIVQNMGGML